LYDRSQTLAITEPRDPALSDDLLVCTKYKSHQEITLWQTFLNLLNDYYLVCYSKDKRQSLLIFFYI
jgi:hypothetical protein